MKTLSADEIKRLLNYDPSTGVFTWVSSRNSGVAGSIAGADNSLGYVRVYVKGRAYLAHRLAWLYMTGAWPIDQIDHINGIRSDNRIENLRECTNAENMQNQSKAMRNSTTGMLGVNRHRDKWQARIMRDGIYHYLGTFSTPEQAQAAYHEAKSRLHYFWNQSNTGRRRGLER